MDLQLVKTGLNFNEIFQSIKHDIVEASVQEVLRRLSRDLAAMPGRAPDQPPTPHIKTPLSYKKRGEQKSFECLLGCGERFTSLLKHGYHLRGCNKKHHMDYPKQIKTFFGTRCSCGASATHLCVRHGSWRDHGVTASKRGYVKALLDVRDRGEVWAKDQYEMRCSTCFAEGRRKRRKAA